MLSWLMAVMSGQRQASDPTMHHLKEDSPFWEAVIKRAISGLALATRVPQ